MSDHNSKLLLSKLATNDEHGENSSYFDGWKAYNNDPFHSTKNPNGVIQMGLAENQLGVDLIKEWIKKNPESSICSNEGVHKFKDVALCQDYHGLPEFRSVIAKIMTKSRKGMKASFDQNNIVMAGGATGANETLMFCLANPGDAFLIPTPYYPGFDRDLRWRTGVQLLPVTCQSSNNFQITKQALEESYENAIKAHLNVRGVIITNPSNPLGTTMDRGTLTSLVTFINDKKIHLVCDEVYASTVFRAPEFISIAEIIEETECNRNLIHIVYSLSKDMGLPGFRVGIVYSYNDTVMECARKMSSFGLVSSQTQHLLASMLSNEEFMGKFLLESRKRLANRHSRFTKGLTEVGIKCVESNAGLFCWTNLRSLLKSNTFEGELDLWKVMISDVKVNVSPGASFHCHEPGWFRVCFANMDDEMVEVALGRIRKFFRRGKEEKESTHEKTLWRGDLRFGLTSLVYDNNVASPCHTSTRTPKALLM